MQRPACPSPPRAGRRRAQRWDLRRPPHRHTPPRAAGPWSLKKAHLVVRGSKLGSP